jgi:para-aminobenzoate synthetase/4-amino-4-deoxychorismate lyase
VRTAGLKQASAPARVPRSVRAVRVPLALEASPTEVLRAAGADPRPFALVGAWSAGGALVGSDPLVVVEDAVDPFSVLDDQPEVTGELESATGGGWVGYLGYGLGRLVERLPPSPRRPVPLPTSMLAFYDHLLRRDQAGRWWFEALWSEEQAERLESRLAEWQRRSSEPATERGEFACGPFLQSPAAEAHLVAVARALEHIRSGDVYQVNVCARLEAGFAGDPLELFCAGADRLGPRFGAYLGFPSSAVASFSPELFLRRRGRQVLTSPIKGTARREPASGQQRELLLGSDKDRAENVMIVDLMRNDLSRVCRYGSVRVPDLCRAEEHPGVWHLVSDVSGELPDGACDADLLRATFPPGSVTGAPKVRAMELVATLEATARELYTGAIGIASPLSGLELNVAIRTFEVAQGRAWLGVGGGIVADSDPDRELEECLDKARPLLTAIGARLDASLVGPSNRERVALARSRSPGSPDPASGVFETLLVLDRRPVDLESHLGRLAASVSCLYGSRPSARLAADVIEAAAGRPGAQRLRVHVRPAPSGTLVVELSISEAPEAFSGVPGPPVVLVPVVVPGGLGRHKWHDRRILADRRSALGLGDVEQLLLVDVDGTVLETERANVFAVCGPILRTPLADSRILAGTTREVVIRAAAAMGFQVSVEPVALAELEFAEEVLLTSAIRGITPVGELRANRTWRTGPATARLAEAVWASWSSRVGGPPVPTGTLLPPKW